ncbi:MAG: hypothetical protein JRI36_06240, partial [Deltaproteobacteria bacterium]|nr:hypothetical protein [Deltaproteobacteria bacterium]
MFFSISLYISLAVFAAGMAYKVSRWFRAGVGPDTHGIAASRRLLVALRGTLSALFSRHVITLLKVFVLDVLLQSWLLKKDFLRWLAHICMYGGFMLLLVMHGLEKIVTGSVFSNYQPTLNPFLFLRDLFA